MFSYRKIGGLRFLTVGPLNIQWSIRKAPRKTVLDRLHSTTLKAQRKAAAKRDLKNKWFNKGWDHGYTVGHRDALCD